MRADRSRFARLRQRANQYVCGRSEEPATDPGMFSGMVTARRRAASRRLVATAHRTVMLETMAEARRNLCSSVHPCILLKVGDNQFYPDNFVPWS